ncbi:MULTISPECIES: glucan 1,4-alpha-maltotetraohydrolase domain-containing protein [unclassified Massilia]|uniref:glucan 1,4-alpha-maltotetraohydrolase domain-containing protein n=1 Tax=unclassified Massilia TaxID=2609279 RepID=UPI001B843E3B|nr:MULTISPECIES: glucan 1,4-alpha-maltotetraohydrolase domain-containing protein [unclassified Massilia]MBQ5939271.1 alpha-amylase [Massilia sp. AB1]MBQ5961351.1 alpha-amylase [Massilia sp. ZL223]
MKKKTRLSAMLAMTTLALSIQASAATPPAQSGNSQAVLLQGFHWNSARYSNPNWYNTLLNNVSDLKGMGITHVWFPPPSDSGAVEGYMPRQLNNLNSKYGSSAELTNVVRAFTNNGIKAVADVVVNHRVGTTGWSDLTNPNWTTWAIVNNDECNCGLGNADTGDGFSAARDLDHRNVGEVQNGITTWLNSTIKPVGFSGLRFDYVKGFGASYAGQYANAFGAEFCVGELWTDLNLNDVNPHRQAIMNWINGTNNSCGAFDFTTKGLLNDALANGNYWRLKDSAGKPQGALGWWPAMSVTFVDNHDTGPSESCSTGQNHWPVPCGAVMQGYAYILSHPGIPTVYYPHIYNWGLKTPIAALMAARKAAGVHSTSAVAIQQATQGLYAAIITGSTRQLAMKIGPNSWSPGAGWTLQTSGTNYAVWMK